MICLRSVLSHLINSQNQYTLEKTFVSIEILFDSNLRTVIFAEDSFSAQ